MGLVCPRGVGTALDRGSWDTVGKLAVPILLEFFLVVYDIEMHPDSMPTNLG